MKPISPSDIAATKREVFPPYVIQAFNELIAKDFVGNRATVKQDDVIAKIIELNPDLKEIDDASNYNARRRILNNGWLNVEEIYRAEGWRVKYDKPGYNESYGAYFIFEKK